MMNIKRALISVTDKTGIVSFAKGLATLGIEILSTGGTAKVLREAHISVVDVSEYTGSPEILDGRLKTLHPKIHGGLLAIRSNQKHMQALKEEGIQPIDLVVVNLYAFEETISKEKCTLHEAIEKIDIGGPTMLRAAAKNYQDVAVVVDPEDYEPLLHEMQQSGELSKRTKFRLAQKVFATTARYESAIASYLTTFEDEETVQEFPRTLGLIYERTQSLRYGENPHQKAALYREVEVNEPSLINAKQLQGKELSYNNIMDTDAAMAIVTDMRDLPFAAVIIKHANPCGASFSSTSLADAFLKARDADPVSAFGGIVALSRNVDIETAELLAETFFEVIVAPSFLPPAFQILKKKKNLRLLEVPKLGSVPALHGYSLRKVVGGLLVQERDLSKELVRTSTIVTRRSPSQEESAALDFAWRLCKHVKSNAIVIAGEDHTLGIGAGQMSRVDAVELALLKMNVSSTSRKGLQVLASDAFFPFRDGIDRAAQARVTAIIQPGGSMRDEEVIAAANEHGIAMAFTGRRHFNH